MKTTIVLFCLSILSFNSVSANANTEISSAFMKEVHDFAMECAIQPYGLDSDGQKFFGPLRSVCPQLRVASSNAWFTLNGIPYQLTMTDSEMSDDSDLNNVQIRRLDTLEVVYEHSYVLAFGDAILALANGDTNFPQVFDPSLQK